MPIQWTYKIKNKNKNSKILIYYSQTTAKHGIHNNSKNTVGKKMRQLFKGDTSLCEK